jgi:rhodanese-related sulfurtransferase
LNKQCLSYFAAILFILLIIAPGIAVAKDNTPGYTNVSACEAKKMIEKGNTFVLDVRTMAEFKAAHIKGATLIPFKNVPLYDPIILSDDKLLPARINEVPKDKKIIVYCKTGGRSLNASKLLVEKEYTNVYNMQGGIPAWIDARYSVVSTFVDESDVDSCTKKVLNAKINCALLHLKRGNDDKAKQELDKFDCFVNTTERVNRISSSQAEYLRHEAELIKEMI